jgi:DNA-binding NtrC family response regulator
VRRIGENERRKVDVRFVTATHRDLRAMVNEGTFREDLYFRLAVLNVRVPPLREREGDIPMLAAKFVPSGATLPPEVLRDLEGRPWRGNVRELRNYVERAIAFGPDRARAAEPAAAAEASRATYHEARAELLARFERDYLAKLLAQHPGNMAAAARHAGVTRAYLYQLIEKHGLR